MKIAITVMRTIKSSSGTNCRLKIANIRGKLCCNGMDDDELHQMKDANSIPVRCKPKFGRFVLFSANFVDHTFYPRLCDDELGRYDQVLD